MKFIIGILIISIITLSFSINYVNNRQLHGTYIQEVNVELIHYFKSTIVLKKRNVYVRKFNLRYSYLDSKGDWFLSNDTLILISNSKEQNKTDSFLIIEGGIQQFGRVPHYKN